MKTDFIEIARYASKAPSGHNTQPWKFHIGDDAITVIPDLTVALPVVDGENRELFISIGCAIENLCIAACHFGYETNITECKAERITIKLTKTNSCAEDSLFSQIERRQTNRSIYNGYRIPDSILQQLQSVCKKSHIRFHFTRIGTPFACTIAEYVMKGNEAQMNDAAFKNELLSWMRFNRKEIERTQDGLSYQVFGNPPLPKMMARPIVNLFLKSGMQNRSDSKKINTSSHFVICTIRHDTFGEWVDTGRMLQRFLLKATETGIACAFLNQPCEVAELASALRSVLTANGEYPALILRIGYAAPLPYSPRKAIETLII